MELLLIRKFFFYITFITYIILCKLRDRGFYDITVTCIKYSRDDLLKCLKFEFRYVFIFFCTWKKDGKVFGKNTVTFWHNKVNLFVCYYIWQLSLILKLFQVLHEKTHKATLWVFRLWRHMNSSTSFSMAPWIARSH